ncbi:MAG: hypothetical protein AB8H86_27810 [Polyangiales bacterium]
MVDPLYRALVLAALGLAGCESTPATDAGAAERDTGEESDVPADVPVDAPLGAPDTPISDAGEEEDAPCPADAELPTPPCYLIL